MKKLIFLILIVISTKLYADDTATIQTALNAGPVTLTAGHGTYNVTSLTIANNLNLNGNILNCTNTTGSALTMSTKRKKISNGAIVGASDVYNASGISGVNMTADSDSLVNVRVHKFTLYGVLAVGCNKPVILFSNIYDTGYIACAIFGGTKNTIGPILFTDTLDRSMLSASTITQPALIVRGDTTGTGTAYLLTNTEITFCLLKMPANPTDGSAACSEVRYLTGGYIYRDSCNAGTIGVSVVRCVGVSVTSSSFINQKAEAIEFTGPSKGYTSDDGYITNCSITSQPHYGILFDYNASGVTISNTNINTCVSYCMSVEVGSGNITVQGGEMQTNTLAINYNFTQGLIMQGAKITSVTYGGHTGSYAINLTSSTGDVKIYGGSITGFTGKAITVYSGTPIVTNNIQMQGVNTTGTPSGINNNGGVTLGPNVKVN